MVTTVRPTNIAVADDLLEMLAGKDLHPIYLVGGEKGGVGKTSISRALCHYLKSRDRDFALVEADSQINDVGRVYHKQATSTDTITLSDHPERSMEPDVILQSAVKALTIVNLPSNTMSALEKWISESRLLEVIDKHCNGQHRIVKWFVSDGCRESIRQLKKSIFAMNGSIPHIVVLNHGRLNGLNFSYLDINPDYQLIAEQPNCVAEIEFPALESAIQFEIDDRELTIKEASKPVSEKLGILAGQRLLNFCRKFSEVFDRAIELEQSWNLEEARKAQGVYGLDEDGADDALQIPEEKPTGEEISAGMEGMESEDTDGTDDSSLPESPGGGCLSEDDND